MWVSWMQQIIDGILYVQYKFNNYKSEDDSSVNNITFQDLDSSENEIKKNFNKQIFFRKKKKKKKKE